MGHSKLQIPALLFLAAALLVPGCIGAQGGNNANAPAIGTIHVTGTKRLSPDSVVAAGGLKSGQPFAAKELDRAAERLTKSGVFDEVNYTYTPQGNLVNITLKVQENTKLRQCIFDNFVWFGDDDLRAQLARRVPLYAGEAPESGDVLDDISAALERISKEKGVAVRVSRSLQQARLGDPNWSHLFTAEGLQVRTQAVSFAGKLTVSSKELEREAADLIGKDYSVARCRAFAAAGLIPFYRERGYLRASMDVAARVLTHTEGSNEFGVEAIYTVIEGSIYRWATSEWKGNQRIPGAELEALTGMKPGDIANARKIDEGWEATKRQYGKNGYIDAKLVAEPVFTDATLQVHYVVETSEGAQYHMGRFQALGMSQAAAERLKSKWRLMPGDIYDATYISEFNRKEVPQALQGAVPRGARIKIRTVPNKEQHTVDITFQIE